MDTGRGYMEEISDDFYHKKEKESPLNSGVFKVGEQIEIKGSIFKIQSIKPKKLVLKLLKKSNNKED